MPETNTVGATRRRALHPMVHAAKWLFADLLSTLVFVALYALTHSLHAAAGLAILVGLGQVLLARLRHRQVDTMQWLSLFLIVAFGGATLLTDDPVFIKSKPTLIYVAVGVVMLRRGWMNRYLTDTLRGRSSKVMTGFGYAWAALMFATAAANALVAVTADTATWALFILVFPIVSKIGLVAVQYMVIRKAVRDRVNAGSAAHP